MAFSIYGNIISGKYIRSLLSEKYYSQGGPFSSREIVSDEETSDCQGCGNSFEGSDLVFVDDVGPVCYHCLYNLARIMLSKNKV